MSQENVEIVRRAYDAFNSNDLEALLALYHADCEIRDPPEMPDSPDVYVGHDGVREWIANARSVGGDVLQLEPERFTPNGDLVLADVHGTGVGQGGDVPFEWTTQAVFTIRDGKLARVRSFFNREQALEAAGLSE